MVTTSAEILKIGLRYCACAFLADNLIDNRNQVLGKNADRRIDYIDIGVAESLPDQMHLGFEAQDCVTAIRRPTEVIVAGSFTLLACTNVGARCESDENSAPTGREVLASSPLYTQGGDLRRERRWAHAEQFGRTTRTVDLAPTLLERFLNAPPFQFEQLFACQRRRKSRRQVDHAGTGRISEIEV
jgi:hypothetical protein